MSKGLWAERTPSGVVWTESSTGAVSWAESGALSSEFSEGAGDDFQSSVVIEDLAGNTFTLTILTNGILVTTAGGTGSCKYRLESAGGLIYFVHIFDASGILGTSLSLGQSNPIVKLFLSDSDRRGWAVEMEDSGVHNTRKV